MAPPRLPSLTALRSFEAVGRRGIAGAAAELDVTPSALSHQVRALETELGATLFTRGRKGLRLNPTGERYLADVSSAFDTLAAGARRLTSPGQPDRLVIDALTSFANDVIIPRLRRLHAACPDFELELKTLGAPGGRPDFHRSRAHAAIRGGGAAGQWPGLVAEKLAHETFFPVCAPALARGEFAIRRPADLSGQLLIAVSGAPEGWPEWIAAAKQQGMRLDLEPSVFFDTIHSATLAAVAGLGVGLGRAPLVDGEIRLGRLVPLFDVAAVSTHAYWLIYPEASRQLPAFRAFREWLFDELAASAASPACPRANFAALTVASRDRHRPFQTR